MAEGMAKHGYCRLPIADCHLLFANCKFPLAVFGLQFAVCRLLFAASAIDK
jgi:hypothetical protein